MLTRRAKAYSSSCLQNIGLSPAISSQFILGVCTAAEDRKINFKNPYFGSSESFKSLLLIRLKSSSLVLVVIGSMPLLICRFHERLTKNNDFYTATTLWCFSAQDSLKVENRELDHRNLRSMLKISCAGFPCLSQYDFGAIRSCNVSHIPKSPKNLLKRLF